MLQRGGAADAGAVAFHAADLTRDDGWSAATAGCDYVLHIASPLPDHVPKDENELIVPARDGTLRVLRAARDAGARRVVLTSAFGAIGVGHKPRSRPFDETDWSDLNGNVAPYQKSKTLAERASWDFIAREGHGMELAAVNPTTVLGPALGADYSHSIRLIKNLLDGQPGCPKINTCVVDVRDVADLHLRAMIDPAANGERFLAASGESLWMVEIARSLKRQLGEHAGKVSTRVLPNWFVRLVALVNPAMKGIVSHLGVNMNASAEKARRLLGWAPRSPEEAICATAESLLRLGLVGAGR